MNKEDILAAITENRYSDSALNPGVNFWMVSPEKLAEFLAKTFMNPSN